MADQDDPPEAPDSPDAPGSRPGARSDPEADGGSGIRPASPPTARRDLRWLVGLDIDALFLAPGRPGLPREASSQEAGLAEAVAACRRAAAPRPPGPESPAPASPGAPAPTVLPPTPCPPGRR